MPRLIPAEALGTLLQTLIVMLRQRLAGEARTVLVVDPGKLSPEGTAALEVLSREALLVRRLEADG